MSEKRRLKAEEAHDLAHEYFDRMLGALPEDIHCLSFEYAAVALIVNNRLQSGKQTLEECGVLKNQLLEFLVAH